MCYQECALIFNTLVVAPSDQKPSPNNIFDICQRDEHEVLKKRQESECNDLTQSACTTLNCGYKSETEDAKYLVVIEGWRSNHPSPKRHGGTKLSI